MIVIKKITEQPNKTDEGNRKQKCIPSVFNGKRKTTEKNKQIKQKAKALIRERGKRRREEQLHASRTVKL